MAPATCWNADPPADVRRPPRADPRPGRASARWSPTCCVGFGLAPDAVDRLQPGRVGRPVRARGPGPTATRCSGGSTPRHCSVPSWPAPARPPAAPGGSPRASRSTGSPASSPAPPRRSARHWRAESRVYLLIVNTPREVVIGGHRAGGRSGWSRHWAAGSCRCRWSARFIARSRGRSRTAYRDLHLLTTDPAAGRPVLQRRVGPRLRARPRVGRRRRSWRRPSHGFDFPAVVERAYADGVRVFVEVGPGASCTRMIARDPRRPPPPGRPRPASPGPDAVATVLDLLGRLIAERVPRRPRVRSTAARPPWPPTAPEPPAPARRLLARRRRRPTVRKSAGPPGRRTAARPPVR